MSMANMNHNAMPTEANTTLTVCVLINGKEILLQALCKEEVVKGVITGWTNVEPKKLQALNETTFLATFAVSILVRRLELPLRELILG